MITESLKSNKHHLRQSKITKNQQMGRECQVNWKNSQSEYKAVPPKVMLGVPKGNTGFKHLITPTAETYSPSACTKAGVYHTGSLSSMSISSSSSSPLYPKYSTLPTNALRPSHRAAGVKPSSTKSFFWHKPKPISLGYKHNCKIPLH